MRGKIPRAGKAKTATRPKRAAGRTFVPKSVSCDPQFLKVATRRASELGYPLSGYIRCLIAHDLTHHVVDPDALAGYPRRKRDERSEGGGAPEPAGDPQGT